MLVRGSVRQIDDSLEEAAKALPSSPIRIRIQPLLRYKTANGTTEFRAWRQLHWTLDVANVQEGREFREALEAFFVIVDRQGVGALKAYLAFSEDPLDNGEGE